MNVRIKMLDKFPCETDIGSNLTEPIRFLLEADENR